MRSKPMMILRGLLAVSALLGAVVGCTAGPVTGSGSSRTTNSAPPTNNAPPTLHTFPRRPHPSTTALIYAAVLGGRQDPRDLPAAVTWVRNRLCDQLVERDKRGPCVSAPIPVALQAEIRAIVGPQIHFTSAPPEPSLEHPVITLGSVRRTGDRAELAVDVRCGPLCGHGETLIVVRKSSGWDSVGSTGLAWIS